MNRLLASQYDLLIDDDLTSFNKLDVDKQLEIAADSECVFQIALSMEAIAVPAEITDEVAEIIEKVAKSI